MNTQANQALASCNKIRDQITDVFTKLPMAEQLALNELLVQMSNCAYQAGVQSVIGLTRREDSEKAIDDFLA